MFKRKPRKQLSDSLTTAVNRPYQEGELNMETSGAMAGRRRDRHTFVLQIERIRPDADQVRRIDKDAEQPEVIELADSIKEHGLINYPEVRYLEDEDIYQLISGERRFTACTKVLGWTEIPVKLSTADEESIPWIQVAENCHRKDLNPLDLAAFLERQKTAGMTTDEMAGRLRKSTSYIRKALNVAKRLSDDAIEALEGSSAINNLHVVYEIASVPKDQQAEVAQEIAQHDMTQAEAMKVTAAAKQGNASQSKKARPKRTKPFEKTYRVAGGGQVVVKFRRSSATDDQIVTALREVITQYKRDIAKAA